MATIGPIPLNKGWVSDSDFWNPPTEGGALKYECIWPWAGGFKTMDSVNLLSQVVDNQEIRGFTYWQDPSEVLNTGVQGDILVACAGSKIYTSPRNSISWTDRTGALSPPSNQYYQFDSLNSILMIVNAGNAPTFAPAKITAYNTNAAALAGSPPTGNLVKVINGFAFISQVLTAESLFSRVYWSNVSDPETWSSTNFLDFRLNDGEVISGLSSIANDLIIFKPNSIGRFTVNPITGTTTMGPLVTLSDRIGCAGNMAYDTMPDGTLVFLSQDKHLYHFDGVTFTDLSAMPWPTSNINFGVNNFTSGNPPLGFGLATASVKIDPANHRIFVVLTAYTGNINPVYVYDYTTKIWADWTNLQSTNEWFRYMNTIPSGTNPNKVGALDKTLSVGTSDGHIGVLSYWGAPIKLDGTTGASCVFETSILLGAIAPSNFIPRSLMIPIRYPTSDTSGTMRVDIGFNGTYKATPEYNSSFPSNGRLIVRIGEQTISNAQHPISMQVKMTLSGNASLGAKTIASIYISDEVIT